MKFNIKFDPYEAGIVCEIESSSQDQAKVLLSIKSKDVELSATLPIDELKLALNKISA